MRAGNVEKGKDSFEEIISNHSLTNHELAVAASTLSFIYQFIGQPDMAKQMLIRAAIADIRSSTKETLAMLNLADMLYKEGDIEKPTPL